MGRKTPPLPISYHKYYENQNPIINYVVKFNYFVVGE
nr:MAG TPA: hypothetical protein [Caudoviricetes sp.]